MYSRHIIRAAHNWTKIVAAIYWYKIQRTEFYINCTFDFSVHQQHHINEWLGWSLLVKWVTDFIICFTRQVWWALSIIQQRSIKSTESPPDRCNISPSDGGDESSDACVDGNMREAATPGPEPVHQTHGGPPWCCVLTVTVVTCNNDNRLTRVKALCQQLEVLSHCLETRHSRNNNPVLS